MPGKGPEWRGRETRLWFQPRGRSGSHKAGARPSLPVILASQLLSGTELTGVPRLRAQSITANTSRGQRSSYSPDQDRCRACVQVPRRESAREAPWEDQTQGRRGSGLTRPGQLQCKVAGEERGLSRSLEGRGWGARVAFVTSQDVRGDRSRPGHRQGRCAGCWWHAQGSLTAGFFRDV